MSDVGCEDNRFQSIVRSIKTAKQDREENDSEVDACFRAARWLPLSKDPFVNLSQVLHVGISKTLGMTIKGLKAIHHMSDKDREYHLKLYQEYITLAPEFEDLVNCLKKEDGALKTFIAKLSTAASDARSEDSTRLKKAGLDYLARDPSKDTISPPLTKDDPKSSRGFNHPATARLLCPIKYLARFDRDPEAMMKALRDGSLKVTAGDWPSFMYEEKDYDPEDKEKGLLRGYTVVRTSRHVFTAPSSALSTMAGRTKGSKKTKAELNGMTNMTPSTIAYSVIQTFWWLCGANQWQEVVGNVNLHKLFLNIVRLFEEEPEDTWCVDTLKWWDEQLPGLRPPTQLVDEKIKDAAAATDDDDDFDAILAARAKRRRTESTATGSTPESISSEIVLPEDSEGKLAIIKDISHTDVDTIPLDRSTITREGISQTQSTYSEMAPPQENLRQDPCPIDDDDSASVLTDVDIDSPRIIDVCDIRHPDTDVPPVDQPMTPLEAADTNTGPINCPINHNATLAETGCASINADIDMAPADEPVDSVASKAGETKAKKGRKAGSRGRGRGRGKKMR